MTQFNASEFERRFRALIVELGPTGNSDCIECTRCTGCSRCTFCRDSERLIGCHYCVQCVLCSNSAHCQNSKSLTHCNHCTASENCIDCSYLVRCVALTECSYCFGCVGLHHADFHILNQPYSRSEYFALTRKLLQDLRLTP